MRNEKNVDRLLVLKLFRGLSFFVFSFVFYFSFSTKALAVCPVCTIAVGGGLILSRFFGIDDLIMSVWIGGMILSTALTFGEYLRKKTKLSATASKLISIFVFYVFLVITLEATHITGVPFNTLWGIDKIILGIILGSIMFFIGAQLHFYLKHKNKNQSLFPFQKVIIPVGSLWIATVIFYFVIY